jgi:hypothetical protein
MGLGNQMFQYAAARALSLEKGVPLKVDTTSYNGYPLRKYELETFFNIATEQASQEEIDQYRYSHPVKRVWNKLFPKHKLRVLGLPYDEKFIPRMLLTLHDVLKPPHQRKTYTERQYHFDKNFFKANNDIYLHGYWMSWKYFEKYDAQIRKDFTVNAQLVSHLASFVACLKKQNSVSIHIRRTDYTNPQVIKLKGLTPISFYVQAIEFIKSKITAPVFYVFSDDMHWVKQNFQAGEATVRYVDEKKNGMIGRLIIIKTCVLHPGYGFD